MEMKIPVIAITALVVIVVLAGVLMPVLDDATAKEDSYINDGYFRVSKIADTDSDVTITWDHSNPYVFTVDGEDVTLPFGSTSGSIFPYTLMCSDEWAIRFTSYNLGASIDLVLYGASTSILWYTSASDGYDVTFSFSGGTFTVGRDGSTTVTRTYTTAYYLSNDGDYVMKKGADASYMNGDSEIYSVGRTSATFSGVNANININLKATIDDGATVTVIAPTDTYTITNEVINYSEDSDHKDLYKFTSVTFDISDGDTTSGATYSQVIVPYEVSAERTVHFNDNENAIFAAIPIMVIVALLIAVVALVFRGRNF